MERKDFINLAFFLPVLSQLKGILTQDELLRFRQADLEPLLKLDSPANKATASLLVKNLAYDVHYILSRVKNINDVGALKNLAIEADQKFYRENNLAATNFAYQSLSLSDLNNFRNNSSVKPGQFDGMVRSLSGHINTLKGSKEDFAAIIIKMLTSPEATGTARAAQEAAAAEDVKSCAKVWAVVRSIVLIVVAIVVLIIAVIGSPFSGGGSLALIAAIPGIVSQQPNMLILKNRILTVGTINVPLDSMKTDFNKIDLDRILKCSISSVAIAAAIGSFGKTAYPQNPIVGSLAINLLGNAYKLQGIDCS
jgi:hypothetical protein